MTIDKLLTDHFGKVAIGMLAAIILLGGFVTWIVAAGLDDIASSIADNKAAFMESCMKDKPEYECTAIWRPWM